MLFFLEVEASLERPPFSLLPSGLLPSRASPGPCPLFVSPRPPATPPSCCGSVLVLVLVLPVMLVVAGHTSPSDRKREAKVSFGFCPSPAAATARPLIGS